MKILYFSNDYCTHDFRFLSAMAENGYEVFHLRLEANTRQVEDRPLPAGVQIVHWAGGQSAFRWIDAPKLVKDFRRVVKQIQPDIVHAGPIQTCAFIAALAGFHPLLTMSWGFDLMEYIYRGAWWRWATRYVLKRSDFFTSDALITRDSALSFGMRPERTVVFPWGVDLAHFSPRNRQKTQQGNGLTLFCNRSWEPRYGVDILAKAFAQACRQSEDISLLLLGGGSQGGQIRQILEQGGVLDKVTFAGQISQKELPRFYHMADVYVSASHVDGSSVSLIEALACGLPCLVSDIPANKEWVVENENGWLFADGNVEELSARILSAAQAEDEELEKLGKNARLTAEAHADWSKNFQALTRVYGLLLDKKGEG